MEELEIENNIDFPPKSTAQIAREMNSGDSMLFENRNKAQALIEALGKGNFISRTVEDGYRVWKK